MDWDSRQVNDVAAAAGLPNGRMISGSKTAYGRRRPRNATVYNATITDEDGEGLWWGDLDLTLDEPGLAALAKALGATLFVFYENDARRLIARDEPPRLGDAVLRITVDGKTAISEEPAPRLARDRAGRLTRATARLAGSR